MPIAADHALMWLLKVFCLSTASTAVIISSEESEATFIYALYELDFHIISYTRSSKPFTEKIVLQNPSYDVSELHKICRPPDLEATKRYVTFISVDKLATYDPDRLFSNFRGSKCFARPS